MPNPIHLLLSLDRLLAQLEKFFLTVMLMAMLFLSFIQVILRDFFNSGFGWSDVLVRYLVLWIGFLGASLATKDNRHLRIDTLSKIIPKKYLPVVELLVYFGSLVVCIFLTVASSGYLKFAQESGKMVFFGALPEWYLLVILPVGFALISFRYLIKIIEGLYQFGGKKEELQHMQKASELDISVQIKLK